jgi:glycosyltransferase involved in cell wall biosynthesis
VTARLRVGVNLLWLLPGAGGAEEYVIRVLGALRRVPDDIDVVILCNRGFAGAHPDLAEAFETAVAPIGGASRIGRVVAESSWLAWVAVRRRLDVVHHTNNVVPWLRTRPSVVTMHDLRPIEMPQTLGRVHGAYLRSRFPVSARRAAVITTPTAFVRQTVVDLLGVSAAKVRIVSAPLPAVDEAAGSATPAGIDGPFFIYPAITTPHKDHRTLIEAFAVVARDRPDARLVLTGASGPAEGDVRASVARLGLQHQVHRLGMVPAARLESLMREAVALVYPSRYEGFGLPLAEAMALGCPVIAAAATALPEVAGNAGMLIEPGDIAGWSSAMRTVLEDRARRDTMAAAGIERVGFLSEGAAATASIQAYRAAVGPSGGRPHATGRARAQT